MKNPFRYFDSSPEVIRLVVMMYVRYPLSLRNVEDLLAERGIDICHETVRLWWNRFGPVFAAEIKKRRRLLRRGCSEWRWHLDEVFVKINGKTHYLWRAVDHEGEVLEVVATKRRDRHAALAFLKKLMKRYGRPHRVVTDRLPSYGAAMRVIGNAGRQECTGRRINNRAENSHQPFRRRERGMLRFRSMPRSRRRNGWWEFSARLLIRLPVHSCRPALPITLMAAPYEGRRSVTTLCGRPYRFIS